MKLNITPFFIVGIKSAGVCSKKDFVRLNDVKKKEEEKLPNNFASLWFYES